METREKDINLLKFKVGLSMPIPWERFASWMGLGLDLKRILLGFFALFSLQPEVCSFEYNVILVSFILAYFISVILPVSFHYVLSVNLEEGLLTAVEEESCLTNTLTLTVLALLLQKFNDMTHSLLLPLKILTIL